MLGETLEPVHPGEILEDFLADTNLKDAARDMGLPVETLTRLLTGDASITSEVAQKLGEYCGTTTGFWVNLQAQYNEDTKQHTAHI
jgi:addiction module antidote protein HigA